jgi:acetoin:2,6-dichlorophenolindophenol oxidoreductase subunit beta
VERLLTYKDAVAEGLAITMRKDENVIILGEDLVGGTGKEDKDLLDSWGGAFRVTKGFIHEFGPKRILDTPITENAFMGAAIGASMKGLRPVVEIMFCDFIGVCFDHFLNQASKQRYMFGGYQKNPITVRTTYGCGWRYAAQHSSVNYSLICHIPGWYVIAPSNPYDVKGGLITAIRNDNPVMVFEHRKLYDVRGNVPEGDYELPFGKGEIKRKGDDLTIVAIGILVGRALNVAEKFAKKGISIEVVDPIWLAPLDKELILDSVKKTGKLLVLDEDNPRCSVASDIARIIACEAIEYIEKPVKILNSPNTPVPFSPVLEDEYIISEDEIEAAIDEIV